MSLAKSELNVLFRASLGSGFSTTTRTEFDAPTHMEMPKPTPALILLLLLAVFPRHTNYIISTCRTELNAMYSADVHAGCLVSTSLSAATDFHIV